MMIGMFQQQDEPDDAVVTEEHSTIRCIKHDHFVALRQIEVARGARFVRALSDEWLALLDPGILYPIIDTMPLAPGIDPLNESIIRVRVMLSNTAVVWADMPDDFYDDLPTAEAAPTILAILADQDTIKQ